MCRDSLEVILDEIALEGLEGITLETLWIRLNQIPDFSLQLDSDQTKCYIFEQIICPTCANTEDLRLFALPAPRPTLQLYNRYEHVNPETGFCISNDDGIPDDIYAVIAPISDNGIKGSCKDYHERQDVTNEVLQQLSRSYDAVLKKYGNRLVIVASQTKREQALCISSIDPFIELSATQFCILERVARSRFMGEITVGKEMANFRENAKTQYYFRKVLIAKGFIRKQVHTMYNSKTHLIFRGLLLMHIRFYVERKSPIEVAAKKMSALLSECPNHECDYNDLKERMNVKPKLYRHLYQAYMKHFSLIERDRLQGKRKVKERIVRLVKPFYGEEDNEEEEEADDDDTNYGTTGTSSFSNELDNRCFTCPERIAKEARIYSPNTLAINRTLLSQAYRIIEAHDSAQGISLRELQDQLKLPRLDVRMLIRMLERLQEVESVRIEIGRQKVSKYFLKHRQKQQFEQMKSQIVDLFPGEKISLTFARRANLILEMVQKVKIIDQINLIKKMLMETEKNLPYTIDQNSVHSIVHKLAKQGLVRWIKTKLVSNDRVTKINIVCVPSITADDPLIRERIEQAKFRYFGKVKEENNEQVNSNETESTALFRPTNKQVVIYRENSERKKSKENHDLILYQPAIGRKYGVEPKIKKLMTLYRFLFYLMSGGPEAGEQHSDWRQFITPLPEGRVEDSCLIGDVVRRIPLCIFVKVVFITYIIPGLNELLQDPIRRNYPLHMISDDIRRLLLHRRKYIFSIIEVFTMLSYLNLVELSSEKISAKESVMVKLCKKVSFKDFDQTRTFELNTLDDVDRFNTELAFHASRSDCTDCSIDFRLSIHNPRNWSYTPKLKQDVKLNLASKRLERLNTSLVCVSSNLKSSHSQTSIKTDQSESNSKRKLAEEVVDNSKRLKLTQSTTNVPKRVRYDYDAVDRKALRLMKKQRCDWSREEDSFLLMCRVASAMLDPTCPSFICVNRSVIRDELHRYLPNLSFDKTSKACQRRVMYMLKTPATKAHVSDWVAECKQDPNLASIKKPNEPKSHTELWNKAFLSLLHKLLRKFETNQQSELGINVNGWLFPKFSTLKEIEQNFRVFESECHLIKSKSSIYQEPQNALDICFNSILNILISTLMSNQFETNVDRSTLISQTLFKMYQKYPDTLIRSVVTKAHRHGMIAKTKNCNYTSSTLFRSKGVIPFKISQHYQFVLRSRFCIDSLVVSLPEVSNYSMFDHFGSSETALTVSLFTLRQAHFRLHIPDNFIILDESNPFYGSTAGTLAFNMKLRPLDDSKNSSRFALYILRQQMETQPCDKIQHVQDYLVLNKCPIQVQSLFLQPFGFANKIQEELKIRQSYCSEPNESDELTSTLDNQLLALIEAKKELGLLQVDAIEHLIQTQKLTHDESVRVLNRLCDANLIYLVGIVDLRLVHHSHALPWKIISTPAPLDYEEEANTGQTLNEQIKFVGRFWKDPFGQIDRKVIFTYLSGVLAHVMAHPGIREDNIINHFSVCLPPTQTLEILDLLILANCLEKSELKSYSSICLFSQHNPIKHRYFEATPQAFIEICHLRNLLFC